MNKVFQYFFGLILLLHGGMVYGQENLAKETAAFESMKGDLPCPSPSGELDRGKLYLESDLKTSAGMDVYGPSDSVLAMHAGVVVSAIPTGKLGFNLILSHGEYFAVYSGLKSVEVESKEMVYPGQLIGHSNKPSNRGFKFHLEIWHNTEKLFPGDWISCQ
jgi:murein DD-endopeptidase MepM/ murein hydrolase activator NlpD